MRCEQCQFENEEGAKFCGNCGAPLAPRTPQPRDTEPASRVGQVYCQQCGSPNVEGSVFCYRCGSRLATQAISRPRPTGERHEATEKTSAAWWLMPIFLAWVGGLIAWVVVREKDRGKARHLLFLGIGITVFWIILTVVVSTLVPYISGF